jgi:hypothetical protein
MSEERLTNAANAHQRAWEAIPWVVNGSASAAQRRVLEAHLPGCDDCRLELARERELQAAIANAPLPAVGPTDAGLRRLFARIDHARIDRAPDAGAAAATDANRPAARRGARSGVQRWLAAAVVVEALALVVLGIGLVVRPDPAPGYTTLSDGVAARGATIRIVPAPDMRIDELQRLLQSLQLEVVAGPNSVGAYELAPQTAQAARALQISTLRADPGLRLVEPIDTPGTTR